MNYRLQNIVDNIGDLIFDIAFEAWHEHKYEIGDWVMWDSPSSNTKSFGEVDYFFKDVNGVIHYIIDPIGGHNRTVIREDSIVEKTKDPRKELKRK